MMKSAAAPKIGTFRTNLPAIPALSARRCSANRLGVPSVHWLGGKDETPRMPFGRSDGSGIERTGGRERRRLVSGIGHGLGSAHLVHLDSPPPIGTFHGAFNDDVLGTASVGYKWDNFRAEFEGGYDEHAFHRTSGVAGPMAG